MTVKTSRYGAFKTLAMNVLLVHVMMNMGENVKDRLEFMFM